MAETSSAISRRFEELDGLRGLAILLVLAWHFVHNPASTSTALDGQLKSIVTGLPFSLGWTGVDLFFILSGFLIGSSIINIKSRKVGLKGYAIKRFFRIVPLYLILLVSYWVAIFTGYLSQSPGLSKWFLGIEPAPIWNFLTFTNNFWHAETNRFGPMWLGVTWSLAIEMQFYLLTPVVVFLARGKALPFICVAICILAFAYRIWLAGDSQVTDAHVLTFARLDTLFIGVLLAWVAFRFPKFELDGKISAIVFLLTIILLMIVVYYHTHDTRIFSQWMQTVGYTLIALLYAGLFMLVHFGKPGSIMRRTFSIAPLRWLGDISYPVYLFHFPVHAVVLYVMKRSSVTADTPSMLATGLITITITLAVAWGMHVTIENPAIKWSRKLAKRAQTTRQRRTLGAQG